MSTSICAQFKPTCHIRRQTKLNNKHRTQYSTKIRSSDEPVSNIIIEYEEKEPVTPEYRFAEVLNGRAAMQGFLWGSLNWVMTGENIIQQIEDPVYAIAASELVPIKHSEATRRTPNMESVFWLKKKKVSKRKTV